MKIIEHNLEESNAYSLFVYAIRSQVTRDYYLRRLRIFFNHINLESDKTIEERCNYFANKGTKDFSWAFNCIVKFLQFQKNRVDKEEITGATLRNFIKAIKLFCEMSDIIDICKKYNVIYLENEKDASSTFSSVYLTPLIRQMINSLEINPDISIQEGTRHDKLLAIANSLLIKHKFNNNVNREELKQIFIEINNKLCFPTPLPANEVEIIWRDAVKFSEKSLQRCKLSIMMKMML